MNPASTLISGSSQDHLEPAMADMHTELHRAINRTHHCPNCPDGWHADYTSPGFTHPTTAGDQQPGDEEAGAR